MFEISHIHWVMQGDCACFPFTVTKRSKQGLTCLHVSGKDIFLDLTVFMDVHGNLGLLGELETVSAVYGLEEGRLSHLSQDGMTRLSFTRDKLIFLRSKAS